MLFFNVIILAAILFFVLRGNATTSQFQSALGGNDTAATDPIDQLSSADIAVSISRSITMAEATAVTNQADTVKAESAVTTANSVVTKPQVVATSLKSRRDIQTYTTAEGDTISSVAAKFNVTSDSIRWSNNVSGDAVAVGVALTIPPVNGIVYTVANGDTPQSLAAKYSASADQIIAFNDAEINGLKPGEKIIIPNGKVQQIIRAASSGYGSGFSYGSSAIYGYNGYDRGFCTYYVATRVAVPSNWGNANTWDNLAPLSGWTVGSTPRPGSIAQSDRGTFGHVAYVEAVSADGTQIKYSDMNGLAGFNKVGTSGWVSATSFPHYIYR